MVINNYTPDLRVFEKNSINLHSKKINVKDEETTFKDVIKNQLEKVNEKQVQSENTTQAYINGEKDIHEAMIASEEAKLSLELAIQVRNKLLNAYEEFSRMQV